MDSQVIFHQVCECTNVQIRFLWGVISFTEVFFVEEYLVYSTILVSDLWQSDSVYIFLYI